MTYPYTKEPFSDPGAEIRAGALEMFETAKADLKAAASRCAREVRVGCKDAPEKRNWFESGLAFVGGIFEGAGEAVWDLVKMGYNMGPLHDIIEFATGDLTAEELAAQKSMMLEDAEALWQALQEDPLEFGKQLGKGLLDWDTWADDPARAIGHLVPDIVAGVLTGGTGTAATRGVKGGVDALDALGDMSKGLRGLDGLGDVGKIDNAIDDLSDLGKLDDLHTGGHVGPRDPFRREMWADDAYDEIRGSTDDVARIAGDEANLRMPDGSQLSADDVLSVKDHVFHQEHLITYGDGETVTKRFDSSPEQAEAWFRLQNGQANDADRLWLLHEKTELEYLKANPGASYNEAHRAANEAANWEREVGLK